MARQSVQDCGVPTALQGFSDSHWKQWRSVRPRGHADGRVDHVLAGPTGIFLVLHLPDVTSALEVLPGVETSPFQQPALVTIAESSRVLARQLPHRYRDSVRPVVCLPDEHEVAEVADGVLVTSSRALGHILRCSPVRLSTSEVSEVSVFLARALEPLPVVPLEGRRGSRLRRWLVGVAAAAAAAAATVTLVPQVGDVVHFW